MKVDFLKFLAVISAILCAVACVDERYDLSDVDTEMTVLPGLSFQLENTENKIVSFENNVVNKVENLIDILPEGTIAITQTSQSSVSVGVPQEALAEGYETAISGSITVRVADFVNGVLPGALVYLPIKPVLEVENPSPVPMLLSGKARSAGHSADFGPYEVPSGKSTIVIDDSSVAALFAPVRDDLTICDLTLKVASSTKATRADDTYVIAVNGYAPLSLEPGDEVVVEYSWDKDDLAAYDLAKFAKKYNVTVESCQVSAEVTSNIPVEISATGTARLDNGSAEAHTLTPAAPGTPASPVTTVVVAEASIPEGASSVSAATVYVTAKVTGSETVYITAEHTLSFQLLEVIFANGITFKP